MNNRIKLILASASPRRHELFLAAGLPHEIFVTDADENPAGAPPRGVPRALWYAMEASRLKCEAAVSALPYDPSVRTFVIAADTVVSHDGESVFGKPKDSADAARMLRVLSDGEHSVIGGVTVAELSETGAGYRVTRGCTTRVKMRSISDGEISAYIATCEHEGKAGAYAVQGLASLFVTEVHGDYPNIVGISVALVEDILRREFGVKLTELWQNP